MFDAKGTLMQERPSWMEQREVQVDVMRDIGLGFLLENRVFQFEGGRVRRRVGSIAVWRVEHAGVLLLLAVSARLAAPTTHLGDAAFPTCSRGACWLYLCLLVVLPDVTVQCVPVDFRDFNVWMELRESTFW